MTSATTSEMTALVHSLIPLTISDQWTRGRVQNGDKAQQVFGALLGKQAGRDVELLNTFEVKTNPGEGGVQLVDEEHFSTRQTLFKETFPGLEFLGFYTTGDTGKIDKQDISLQAQAKRLAESPYLLKLNAAEPIYLKKLSLAVYESDPSNEAQASFREVPVKIVSELAEQIGLDHMVRHSTSGSKTESSAAKNLSAHIGAMSNLMSGIKAAHEYIKAVQEGTIEGDQETLRDIYRMVQKLSVPKTEEVRAMEMRAADHKLVLLLTSMTEAQGSMHELISRLNMMSNDRFAAMNAMMMKKHSRGGHPFLHERMFF